MLVVFGLTSKSRSLSARRSEDGIERADLDLSQPVLERAMDDLFNPHTIAKQTILNILGVGERLLVARATQKYQAMLTESVSESLSLSVCHTFHVPISHHHLKSLHSKTRGNI